MKLSSVFAIVSLVAASLGAASSAYSQSNRVEKAEAIEISEALAHNETLTVEQEEMVLEVVSDTISEAVNTKAVYTLKFTLRDLAIDSNGEIKIECNPDTNEVFVTVDAADDIRNAINDTILATMGIDDTFILHVD